MSNSIFAELQKFQYDVGTTVLFLCDNGSRSWNIDISSSDHDLKFIYKRDRDWYISLNVADKRDVIERNIEKLNVELVGWDIFKTLHLVKKSNPTLFEMLSSPLTYITTPQSEEIKRYLFEHPNYRAIYCAYNSTAHFYFSKFQKKHLVKDLLGCIRNLLLMEWYAKCPKLTQVSIPHSFDELLIGHSLFYLPDVVQKLIDYRKQGNSEIYDVNPLFYQFIEDSFNSYSPNSISLDDWNESDYKELDIMYRNIIL